MTKNQKTIIIIIVVLFTSLFLTTQKGDSSDLPPAIGDPLELILVKDLKSFDEPFFKTLKQLLTTTIGPSPQAENTLNISEVNSSGFKGVLKRHQNILITSKSEQFSISFQRNLFALDQVVFFIQSPSNEQLLNNKSQIISLVKQIKNIEINRLSSKFTAYSNQEIEKRIQETHKISLKIPKDFFFAHSDSTVTWVRRETPKLSQGILVVSSEKKHHPGSTDLIIEYVDSIVGSHISGPVKNSYMTHEKYAPIKTEEIKIAEFTALKIQSLWKMENDFMGGVFNIYYFYLEKDPVLIYTYLYAPGERKNLPLLQLEAAVNTIIF